LLGHLYHLLMLYRHVRIGALGPSMLDDSCFALDVQIFEACRPSYDVISRSRPLLRKGRI